MFVAENGKYVIFDVAPNLLNRNTSDILHGTGLEPRHLHTHTHTHIYIYRVSQEECARLGEGVPCAKIRVRIPI